MKATLEFDPAAELTEHRAAVDAMRLLAFARWAREYAFAIRVTGPDPPDAHHAKQQTSRAILEKLRPVDHLL